MQNIAAKGVGKSYGRKVILRDINVTVSSSSRLAIVGENGAGKTTLLKILSGLIEPDSGSLFGTANHCAYIAQDFSGDLTQTVEEYLVERVRRPERAIRLLEEAGFAVGKRQERLALQCQDLSGGERKKLEIAAAFAGGTDFIALDEPENHLDYHTIEWLVMRLSEFRGGVAFVSHDQYFIDQVADSILELEDGSLTTYTMRYKEYLQEKERQIGGESRQWMLEQKTITRLRNTVEIMRVRAQRTSKTAKTYQQTKRRFEELKDRHGARPTSEHERPKVALERVDQKKGKMIVAVRELGFSYGSMTIFKNANAELRFGEKVVLFGRNGSGKSTLLKLIAGELQPLQGEAFIGQNIAWQVLTQNHLEGIDPRKSAYEVFENLLSWPESRSRGYLAKYGIKATEVLRPLGELSGGQQARFKLALVFAQKPEFLILDEPTNHVDPSTWEAIVEAIKKYEGTVLAVTHDRAFIDEVAERLWIIEDKKITIELGNLNDYIDRAA